MEKILALNNQVETRRELSLQYMADNRVQTLKSLTALLLHELESLERLTPKKNTDLLETENISLCSEVENYEKELIRSALIQTHGHQRKAAKILGIKMTTLHAKLKRFDIKPQTFVVTVSKIYV